MEKKNLQVNCATCDMRKISEELAESYNKIGVNAATVLTSENANLIIAKYGITLNAANIVVLSEDVENRSANGTMEIKRTTAFQKPTILNVNGKLMIMPEAEEALKNVVGICVNGMLMYPDNLEGNLPPVKVNGSVVVYPGDAVLLKNSVVVDKIFMMRAKCGKYYAKNSFMLLDESLNINLLVEKGVMLLTKKAFVASSLLKNAISLFQDTTEIVEVPDGCVYIDDDVVLGDHILRKYGSHLLIDGDLIINEDGLEALQQLAYVYVDGDIDTFEEYADTLDQVEHYEDNLILRSKDVCYMNALPFLKITKALLEDEKRKLVINECAVVEIEENVPAELLLEKVKIQNTATIECAAAQKAVVHMLAEDCAIIRAYGEREAGGEEDSSIRMNASDYTF